MTKPQLGTAALVGIFILGILLAVLLAIFSSGDSPYPLLASFLALLMAVVVTAFSVWVKGGKRSRITFGTVGGLLLALLSLRLVGAVLGWLDMRGVVAECQRVIERSAKYDYQWTDGLFEPKFKHGILLTQDETDHQYHPALLGNAIKFQNGLGLFVRAKYECVYDESRTVTRVWIDDTPVYPPE